MADDVEADPFVKWNQDLETCWSILSQSLQVSFYGEHFDFVFIDWEKLLNFETSK